MTAIVRRTLRSWTPWLQFQELRREGFIAAHQRARFQAPILTTPPIRTSATGPVEVRVLTWRRDWVNLVWALKTFYHFANVDYPLVIHDGGLLPRQVPCLLAHFPDARFVPAADADSRIPAELRRRGLTRSAERRARSHLNRKLFDFYLDSTTDYILTIDSDIVFFRRPDALVLPPGGWSRNQYNRDSGTWYSASPEDLETQVGVRPSPCVNSGLSLVRRESIAFEDIEKYFNKSDLFEDTWLTEQTLHALLSTSYGLDFLPDSYRVGGPPGLTPDLVCKHYPGTFRPLLYTEGMRHLLNTGLITALRSVGGS